MINVNTIVCVLTSSCRDLIFTNIKFVKMAGTISLHLSDHVPIFLIKKKPRSESSPVKFKTRGSRFDYQLLEHELNKLNWDYVWHKEDPSRLWDMMFKDIIRVADKLYPMREFIVKNDRPEYINDEIIRLGKERDAAFEKDAIPKANDDWEARLLPTGKLKVG